MLYTLSVIAIAQQTPKRGSTADYNKPAQSAFPSIQELVKMYAPKVYLYSKEKYKMSSVDWYLRRVNLEERITDSTVLIGDEILSYANGDRFKLLSDDVSDQNIADHNLIPNNEDIVLSHKTKRVGYGSQFWAKCYVHVKPSYYQNILPIFVHELDIQYHFFYPFNGTALHHEGDWETFIVKVSPDGSIKKMGLSAHGHMKWYNADQLSFHNTHPIIYAAKKSHAFFEDKGHYVPAVFTSPDLTNKGRVFKSWHNYQIVAIDSSIVSVENNRPVENNGVKMKENNWLNYTGKWGKKGANVDIGILGVHEGSKGPVSPKTNADYWSGKRTNLDQGYLTPFLFNQYPDSLIFGPETIDSNGYSTYSINNLPSNTKVLSWNVKSVNSTIAINDLVIKQTAPDNSSFSLKVKQLSSEMDIEITVILSSDYGSYKILDKLSKRVRLLNSTISKE